MGRSKTIAPTRTALDQGEKRKKVSCCENFKKCMRMALLNKVRHWKTLQQVLVFFLVLFVTSFTCVGFFVFLDLQLVIDAARFHTSEVTNQVHVK